MNDCVLVISDMHHPYAHPDTVEFLSAVKKELKPDKVICVGDECDFHAISYHDKDPNLFSPAQELEAAKKRLKPIYKLFPEVTVLNSNHGSLVARKIKSSGIMASVMRTLNEILEAPAEWKWVDEITLTLPNKQQVYLHHGMNSNVIKTSTSLGMSCVFGHYHSKFNIEYWSSPSGLFWAMQVGCLIDTKSLAFAYNKLDIKRPIIGCGAIVNSLPVLIPMILDKNGRWIKKL